MYFGNSFYATIFVYLQVQEEKFNTTYTASWDWLLSTLLIKRTLLKSKEGDLG